MANGGVFPYFPSIWPANACPGDAVHGWDVGATSGHTRRRCHPLQSGGRRGQRGPGGRAVAGIRTGFPAAAEEDITEDVEVVPDE